MRIIYQLGLREPFQFVITVSAGDTVTLPLINGYLYNCWVYWGDGKRNHITTYNDSGATHQYSSGGDYTISIHNRCQGFGFYQGASTSMQAKLKEVVQWGNCDFRQLNFQNATALAALPSGKLTGVSKIQNLAAFLYGCSGLTSELNDQWFTDCGTCTVAPGLFEFSGLTGGSDNYIPVNLLAPLVNVAAYGFWSCFQSMSGLAGFYVPEDLFMYNTKLTTSAFRDLFNGTLIGGTIPAGLFRNNNLVSTDAFYQTFLSSYDIEGFEAGLLHYSYHPNVTGNGYRGTFSGCNKAQYNRNIFFEDDEEATAFHDKSPNFQNCFFRSSFTGVQGEAPHLWDCDFGTGTPTKTSCFSGAGNSLTSLSNYGDIPAAWI